MKSFFAWYGSLPKPIQALAMTLESAIAAVLIVWLSSPGLQLSKASLHQLLVGIGGACAVALANWLKKSPFEVQQ